MKTKLAFALLSLTLVVTGYLLIRFYPFVFARTVQGEIVGVDRVTQPSAILTTDPKAIPPAQLFSFAVAIRDTDGEIVTASSEDRQWAVVQKGQCAVAKFFRYPPWNLEKAGTFFGARLEKLQDCK